LAQNTVDKVESALNNFAHAEADFINTYIQKIDSLIPFSGTSDPQVNNGVEKAAAVAGTVASFVVPEGEGGKLAATGLKVSEHAAAAMAEHDVSEAMAKKAIQVGEKFFDPKNGSVVSVVRKGMASGKDLAVARGAVSGEVTTVMVNKNAVRPRFIPID
jgi:hypothetical protein